MVKNGSLVRNHLTPRESGLKGLFRGLDSKLLQSVLAAGFMFLAYEKVFHVIITIIAIIIIFKKKTKKITNLKIPFHKRLLLWCLPSLGPEEKPRIAGHFLQH